jgi:hypothetical protein
MRDEMRDLAAGIDAQLAELSPRLRVAARSGLIAGIQSSVQREAIEQSRRRRWRRIGATWGAAAAVLVLAIGWRAPVVVPMDMYAGVESDTVLDAWMDASAETDASFTMLNDDSWLSAETSYEAEQGGSDGLDSIEQSFEVFESIFGA